MGNAIDEGVAVEVRYSGDCLEKLRILCGDSVDRVGFRPQKGEDLGQRLAEASATAFQEGSSRVAIIGTDCPQLDSSIALKTFLLLDKCDVVLGPAADGGYYLIATRKLVPQLFERIPWGGPTVLRDTLSRALGLDLTVELLPTLTDVDRIEDIHLIGPEYITNCG
jgi:rSAM/selenodomain-associated transferase 1